MQREGRGRVASKLAKLAGLEALLSSSPLLGSFVQLRHLPVSSWSICADFLARMPLRCRQFHLHHSSPSESSHADSARSYGFDRLPIEYKNSTDPLLQPTAFQPSHISFTSHHGYQRTHRTHLGPSSQLDEASRHQKSLREEDCNRRVSRETSPSLSPVFLGSDIRLAFFAFPGSAP